MPVRVFTTNNDIGSLKDKVIPSTGGKTKNMLGVQCVLRLAPKHASRTYLTGRDSKLSSVQAAANKILSEQSRVDLLMANTGVMNQPHGLTSDGYEVQFGTNFPRHALLIMKLFPLMSQTVRLSESDVRIIQLTSTNFRRELARHYPDIVSVSVTPGIVGTELVSKQNAFHRATILQGRIYSIERAPIRQGALYERVGVLSRLATKYTCDEELAKRLWVWTEAELEN
ncbi:oxidoreductase [Xylaria venustula]|nr:oxidoreductase [Xylaria venustula]